MTLADGTVAVFTIVNTLRFLAYVPQVTKALKDQSGAEAISFATWGLFLGSHLSGMAYAVVNQSDWKMASLFLSNAIGCGAILLIAGWKRCSTASGRPTTNNGTAASLPRCRHIC